jgi:hypothetical protein
LGGKGQSLGSWALIPPSRYGHPLSRLPENSPPSSRRSIKVRWTSEDAEAH